MTIIRKIAMIFLFCSIIPLFFVNADNLCIGNSNDILKLTEIQSSGNDDNVIFILFAILTLFYLPVLILAKNKIGYGILVIAYFYLVFLPFQWLESSTFYSIVKTSIMYCQNYFLAIFLIGQALFLILSGLFLVSKPTFKPS